jgi:glutamate-1-semialdehyde 2,1-aminomutase
MPADWRWWKRPGAAPPAASHADLFQRALAVSPGGVHSPVRAFRRVGGTPVFMASGRGSRLTDVTGREYVDFCLAFGPLILGHAPPAVLAAVTAAAARGWSYGTAEPWSLALAELVTGRVPWVESLRFVNSGTEAVMSALRIARAATGRDKVLKFEGCYHGHTDAMLIGAGSGLAGETRADSAGIPDGVADDTLVARLDDVAGLEELFATRGGELAAAIIEPLPANFGLLPQRPEFLDALAWQCQQHGVLLIFDEVITGFRVAFGGMAEVLGIRPDLVTYGKILGGGFPVGAYGGRRELMELVAPAGPVYQAGTLAANPVAMAAGLATLEALADGSVYGKLEQLGRQLDERLAGIPHLNHTRVGSLFWLQPGVERGTVSRAPASVSKAIEEPYAALFHRALEAGVYLPPSPYEVGFLCDAHREADIDALARILGRALSADSGT